MAYKCRFGRLGELPDIEKVLWAQQEAVRITPEGSEDLPKRLSNLGGSFVDRFERSGELSDIAEAISALQKAVQLTPEYIPYFPDLLTSLGGTYFRRFDRTDLFTVTPPELPTPGSGRPNTCPTSTHRLTNEAHPLRVTPPSTYTFPSTTTGTTPGTPLNFLPPTFPAISFTNLASKLSRSPPFSILLQYMYSPSLSPM
ncbi:hypothetical protein DFP72DRAFT_1175502 [Ephemerocybe angulata]|uniref:Uncharacterized protein n=1 Tax=Ephemerocybe angulata TaxID=980116 RepID=A0A8H6HGY7_9AGAR|nr:hypothetical protein DFP72DRAFT_1175502 [Tulosesus angulatus]